MAFAVNTKLCGLAAAPIKNIFYYCWRWLLATPHAKIRATVIICFSIRLLSRFSLTPLLDFYRQLRFANATQPGEHGGLHAYALAVLQRCT